MSWLLPGLLTAYVVGARRPLRTAIVGLGVAVAGDLFVTAATPPADRDLAGLAPGLVMGVLAWWAARTVLARERRREALAALATELARAENAESRLAAAGQRVEVARELHDVGAHALTEVCLQAGPPGGCGIATSTRPAVADPGPAARAALWIPDRVSRWPLPGW